MKQRIASADGLKGIAILAVIFTHTLGRHLAAGKDSVLVAGYHLSPWTWLINARAGVSVFFLLSGFLLALPYADGRREMASWSDVKRFWMGRARRLLPLYYLALFVILGFTYRQLGLDDAIRYALLLGSFIFPFVDWYPDVPSVLRPGFGPLWYVGTLFWLLVLFPALVGCMKRFGPWRVAIAAIVINSAVRLWGAFPVQGVGADPDLLLLAFRLRLDEFVLGMALAYIGTTRYKATHAFTGFAVVTAGFLLTDAVRLQEAPSVALAAASLCIAAGLAVLLRAALSLDQRMEYALFPAWLRSIGRMSYPLYLLHGIVILWLGAPWNSADYAAFALLTLAVSCAAHLVFERR